MQMLWLDVSEESEFFPSLPVTLENVHGWRRDFKTPQVHFEKNGSADKTIWHRAASSCLTTGIFLTVEA